MKMPQVMLLGVALVAPIARAEAPTCQRVDRTNLVACALEHSPALIAENASLRTSEGRVEAAKPFLPSNPVFGGSVASRVSATDRALNWYLSLGQEIEIAGQSWLRTEVAVEEVRAQLHHGAAVKEEVAQRTWQLYFAARAEAERLALARELARWTSAVATTIRAMSEKGVVPDIETDLAEAAALRAQHACLKLEGSHRGLLVQLALATSGATEIDLTIGALDPVSFTRASFELRPEIQALKKTRDALELRVHLLRRERLPNPTFQLYAQNDGFNERVLGVGMSVPLPLPQPVGRTKAGDIASTVAHAERLRADLTALERDFRSELMAADIQFETAKKTAELYTADRLKRVHERLESVASQVAAARMPVRDALDVQRALMEQLLAHVDAREALCLASVRFARATGTSLAQQ